ncbi:MAG: TIGR02206 family membrane protein [Firmicutes bacterium]|jgi:hypothetical integral membrane protein (TIGR02206 family)|nr:TIGR02206 family membrane protein [Bacillota bacterium]
MNLIFWGSENVGRTFHVFSLEHFLGVAFVALLILIIRYFGDKLFTKDKAVRYTIAFVMFMQQFLLYLWYISSGSFSLAESLPLYTCRIAILLSIVMLIKKSYKIFELVYFWGIVGGIIALITPDTSSFAFPHLMFDQYFLGHGFLLAGIYYMMRLHGFRVKKSSLKKTFMITIIYTLCIIPINFLVGGNYSYLSGKPSSKTLLDLLPVYPYYVPIFIGIMFFFFYLAYLPFRESKTEDVQVLVD